MTLEDGTVANLDSIENNALSSQASRPRTLPRPADYPFDLERSSERVSFTQGV